MEMFSGDTEYWLRARKNAELLATRLLLLISLCCLLLVIYEIGLTHPPATLQVIHQIYSWAAAVLFLLLLFKAALEFQWNRKQLLSKLPEYLIIFVLFVALDARLIITPLFGGEVGILQVLSSNILLYILFTLLFFIEFSKSSIDILRLSLNPALVFVGSFSLIIFVGTGLLLLPNATTEGISLVDAFFTSTSAVCVTGLIVMDTATEFTFLGQLFILILIQIGALGIMTFTSFFGFFFRGNTSFQSQIFLKDILNEEKLSDIFKTLLKIMVFTISLELVGALCIYAVISPELWTQNGDRIWFSIFHAISGFCNAGFSTLTNSLYETGFRTNYDLHLIIAVLIVIGGIGFPIIFNFWRYLKSLTLRYARKFYKGVPFVHVPRIINVNTKIVVITTIALLVVGGAAFFITEYNNSLEGKSLYGQIVTVIFGTVTPRTAGFNTVDMTSIALPTILIYLLLMWIGASPGSTGGGIKTSTFALALMNTVSISKGKDRVEFLKREIHNESVRRALSIILLSLLVISAAIFCVSIADPQLELIAIIFECISAYSTVGLSLGITGELSTFSKIVITITMFTGRVGMLTILVALIRKVGQLNYRYPGESIFIN